MIRIDWTTQYGLLGHRSELINPSVDYRVSYLADLVILSKQHNY